METKKAYVNMSHEKDMRFKARVLEANAKNIFDPMHKRVPGKVKIHRSKRALQSMKSKKLSQTEFTVSKEGGSISNSIEMSRKKRISFVVE